MHNKKTDSRVIAHLFQILTSLKKWSTTTLLQPATPDISDVDFKVKYILYTNKYLTLLSVYVGVNQNFEFGVNGYRYRLFFLSVLQSEKTS